MKSLRQAVVVLSGFLTACSGFPYSGVIEESRRYVTEQNPSAFQSTSSGEKIQFATMGNSNGPIVLFVHGSPGNWAASAHFFKNRRLLKDFQLVTFDRFGYGANRQGEPVESLAEQIKAPLAILRELSAAQRKVIVVGHSYGGPVAVKLAIEAPEMIDGMVLVAASVDPQLEEMQWYQYVARVWGIRHMIPDDLDVCNREILALKPELEKMLPGYSKIKVPTEVIHGSIDKLVPIENAEFLKQRLSPATTRYTLVDGMKHFVPWAFPGLIEDAIYRLAPIEK